MVMIPILFLFYNLTISHSICLADFRIFMCVVLLPFFRCGSVRVSWFRCPDRDVSHVTTLLQYNLYFYVNGGLRPPRAIPITVYY